uniref:Uncharacterized protein n=1 Tax=Anguilla anguilla TaxID=7936 RepID=A0A0E9R6I5_ANGAN
MLGPLPTLLAVFNYYYSYYCSPLKVSEAQQP